MKASVFIATSLDGYIARTDGALDWLPESPEDHGYNDFMATVDALVMGRGTFETVLTFGAWPFTKPVYVLSSSPNKLKAPAGAQCEFLSGTPVEVVAQLSERGVKHIYLDGGVTITRFLEAGLVQRVIITRIPVLIGSGIPLFGHLPRDVRLDHITTQSYKSGLVQSEYAVVV